MFSTLESTKSTTQLSKRKFLIIYLIFSLRVAFPLSVFSAFGLNEKTSLSGAFNSMKSVNNSRVLVQKCLAASGFCGFKANTAPCQRRSKSSDTMESLLPISMSSVFSSGNINKINNGGIGKSTQFDKNRSYESFFPLNVLKGFERSDARSRIKIIQRFIRGQQ